MSDIAKLFDRSVDEFDKRVQLIKDDQWQLPTPCTDWNVHDLVNHIVNEDMWVPPLLEGKTIAEVGDAFDGDLLGHDAVGSWGAAAKSAKAAAHEPGALERIVHVSFGDIPGEVYVSQVYMDHVIHAWDLARAIGDDEKLDPELVQDCYARAAPIEDALKSSGLYGEKIEPPPGADTQTKLLAIVGRRA